MPRRQSHDTGSDSTAIGPAPSPGAPPLPSARAWQIIFFTIFAVVAAALYTARILQPGLDSGEFWSDANIINGCRGYDQVGFSATWGIPRIELAAGVDEPEAMYLTYPPGPYWFSYAAWTAGRVLGVDPVLSTRLFAQTCGLASALLAFLLFTRLTHSRALGSLAALFYILSSPFLSLSAALHHMAYSPMLLFAAMLSWLGFERAVGRRRVTLLALCAVLFFVDCWLNFEHMFFFALFVGVRTAMHFRWPVILGAGLIGPIPIPVMLLRVLHNAQVLPGWDFSMRLFLTRARERAGSGTRTVDYAALLQNWLGRLGWPWVDLPTSRLEWNAVFRYPVLSPWVLGAVAVCVVCVAWAWSARRRAARAARTVGEESSTPPAAEPSPRARFLVWTLPAAIKADSPAVLGVANGLLLLAGGLTWFIVMTQHTYPHRFIVLLLMPGLALLLGTLAWSVLATGAARTGGARGDARAGLRGRWGRLPASALVLCLFVAFAAEVRRTDVLNHLAPMDPEIRSMVRKRAETNAHVAIAGRALSRMGVNRVVVYDGVNAIPWRAASIGLPFRYVRGEDVPTALTPDEAVYVEAFDAFERAACLAMIERFGLPETVARTDDRAFVFRPREAPRPGDVTLDVPLAPGLTLRGMRSGASLVGESVTLSLWVTGELEPASPEAGTPSGGSAETVTPLHRFAFTFRARAPGGREVAKVTSRLEWSQVRSPSAAILTLVLPAKALTPDCTLELSVWDRRERVPVVLGGLAEGVTAGAHRRVLRWPMPAR